MACAATRIARRTPAAVDQFDTPRARTFVQCCETSDRESAKTRNDVGTRLTRIDRHLGALQRKWTAAIWQRVEVESGQCQGVGRARGDAAPTTQAAVAQPHALDGNVEYADRARRLARMTAAEIASHRQTCAFVQLQARIGMQLQQGSSPRGLGRWQLGTVTALGRVMSRKISAGSLNL
jgi:hypothetical protein